MSPQALPSFPIPPELAELITAGRYRYDPQCFRCVAPATAIVERKRLGLVSVCGRHYAEPKETPTKAARGKR